MHTNDQHISREAADDSVTDLILNGSREHLDTCSLVLSAVGIPHAVNLQQSIITVPHAYSETARLQLKRYFQENRGWPEKKLPVKNQVSSDSPPTLLTIGGLALFYLVTGPWQGNNPWFAAGAVDSKAILDQGEWWRLITALTLHADQVHVLGNCVIGGFLVHLLCRAIGPGLGWFALIANGALGNLLNIMLRDHVHLSVGFSTSIFAAIGIFSGLQILSGNRIRLRELLLPLGAGTALLAMLGTEGKQTDLGAHFFGFACGLVFGFLLARFNVPKLTGNSPLQKTLLICTLVMVILSWTLARL